MTTPPLAWTTSRLIAPPLARFALTLLAAAVLSACNGNTDNGSTDSVKPTITLNNATLVNGVVLAASGSGTPVSFTIASAGRIQATDNAGAVTLTIQDVVGLDKSQIDLAKDGTLTAKNILPDTPIGRGYVTIRATDASGNTADLPVYFDISPVTTDTDLSAAPGETVTRKLKVMDSVRSAVLSLPGSPVGVSGTAVLSGSEVTVTLITTSSASGMVYPQLTLTDAAGKIYTLAFSLGLDNPTTYVAPTVSVNQANGTVTVTNAGSVVSDADGVISKTFVLSANGVRITSANGIFSNVAAGTYTLSIDAQVKNGTTGATVSVTSPDTASVVVNAIPVDHPTTYVAPAVSVNQANGTVTVTNVGSVITDADGVQSKSFILSGSGGVQMTSTNGIFSNVPAGTYTLSVNGQVIDGSTGKVVSVTDPNTTSVTVNAIDTTPPSKVSENLPNIDLGGVTNSWTVTMSEDLGSVSGAKFVDAKTGATLSGGAASVAVDATNPKVVDVSYSIPALGWDTVKLQFTAVDKAGNSSLIESAVYSIN